jgi:tRNA dimethylallyltransferase
MINHACRIVLIFNLFYLNSMNALPLIAICGTTGVGKSKLAIELALHLTRDSTRDGWRGARVINADAMQVYRGLDIITNKTPESERQGVEHLLMGFKAPGEQYVVGQWVQDALTVVSSLV